LYGTTRNFLNHLGLKGLNQLPKLPEIAEVIDDREELKKFAHKLGQEISDTDLQLLEKNTPDPDQGAETGGRDPIANLSAVSTILPSSTAGASDESEEGLDRVEKSRDERGAS
jgi:hypothetical protein